MAQDLRSGLSRCLFARGAERREALLSLAVVMAVVGYDDSKDAHEAIIMVVILTLLIMMIVMMVIVIMIMRRLMLLVVLIMVMKMVMTKC